MKVTIPLTLPFIDYGRPETFVICSTGDQSVILLPSIYNLSKLVNPAKGDKSVIWLLSRSSDVKLIKPDNGDKSVIWLSQRLKYVKGIVALTLRTLMGLPFFIHLPTVQAF